MRPEKAYRLVNNAFKPFHKMDVDLDDGLKGFHKHDVKKAVKVMLEKSITYSKHLAKLWDEEYTETDMYYPESLGDRESVSGQMFYISDRWNCTGRLKFLVAVLEKNIKQSA